MEIKVRKFARRKKGEPFCIMPLGDIQWTGREDGIALDLLHERIEYGVANNAQFLGMGDYIDFASPSNRAALASAKIYDNARDVIEDAAMSLTDDVYDRILKPTKGRWLGLLEGHHFYQMSDGLTTDWVLAKKLGTEHLGWSSFIQVEITGQRPVVIWASHGCGSGQLAGSLSNKLERIAQSFEAEIYCMGHWTKTSYQPIQRLYPRWDTDPPSLEHRTLHLVGTGGFSKGYVERHRDGSTPRGTYVEQNLMKPTVLGCPLIKIYADGKIRVELD